MEVNGSLGLVIDNWPSRTNFRKQVTLAGGGALIDTGLHLVDLAVWLFGDAPVNLEYHAVESMGWGVEDDAQVTMSFANGGQARLACSHTHGLSGRLIVRGKRGYVSTTLDASKLSYYAQDALVCRRDGTQGLDSDDGNSYERQVAHFCRALADDIPFMVTRQEVIWGLSVIEECYRSYRGQTKPQEETRI